MNGIRNIIKRPQNSITWFVSVQTLEQTCQKANISYKANRLGDLGQVIFLHLIFIIYRIEIVIIPTYRTVMIMK